MVLSTKELFFTYCLVFWLLEFLCTKNWGTLVQTKSAITIQSVSLFCYVNEDRNVHCWDRNVHCLSKHIPLSFLSESLLTKENIAMVMRTAKILARASHHFHPSACMYTLAYPGVSVQRKVKKKINYHLF